MKAKRILSLVLCVALLAGLALPAAAAESKISVSPIDIMVGGKIFLPTDESGKDVPVFVYEGTTYAPLRALAEAYGLSVGYDSEKKLATVDGTPSGSFSGTKGKEKALTAPATISVHPINIMVNGAVFLPKDVTGRDVEVFVYNGTTYAPLRALAEAYGLSVGYDNSKKLATVDFAVPSAENLSFFSLMEEASASRKAEMLSPTVFTGFSDYLVNDPSTKNLLSDAELASLFGGTPRRDYVTHEQAADDMDLLFRLLHMSYGAYYFFGKEAFDEAEDHVRSWLDGQTKVSVNELENVLRESLDFMVDAHSFVGKTVDTLDGIRYEYHYCDLQFEKDAKGFFTISDNQRLDFVSFSDSRVSMEPSLLASGEIVYSPVLFCPDSEAVASTLSLKHPDGSLRTETLNWEGTNEYSFSNEPDFRYIEENGLAYISIRSFDEARHSELYEKFALTGSQVTDCKAIIFDLRCNSGGQESSIYQWVYNFAGEYPLLRQAAASRFSLLNSGNMISTYEPARIDSGKWIENDIPIVVLVNDYCASAGETALNVLKTLDNVLVVGSNSSGYQLGGNTWGVNLPNTGIFANIGTALRFFFDMENVDCVGYTPDLWCIPDNALDAALNMLVNSGLATSSDISAMRESISSEIAGVDTFIVGFGGEYIQDEGTIYANSGTHLMNVYFNGVPTADFTLLNSSPSVCTTEILEGGLVKINVIGYGCAILTLEHGDTQSMFYFLALGPEFDQNSTTPALTLGFFEFNIRPDGAFGSSAGSGDYVLPVFLDGVQTTDFTVTGYHPNECSVTKSEDGCIVVNATVPGDYGITVRCGDIERTFVWHAGA